MRNIARWKVKPIFTLIIFGVLIYLPLWIGSFYIASSQHIDMLHRFPVLGSDSIEYMTLAHNLSNLHCFTMTDCTTHETFRTPGYPFFIYAISAIFRSIFAVTFIQCCLALLTGYFVYRIVFPYAGERVAQYMMILFILEPSVILHSLALLSDVPYVFLVAYAFFLLVIRKPAISAIGYLSFLLGLSVLFRPISIFILPIFLFIYFYLYFPHDKRSALHAVMVSACLFSIPLLPWLYRNYKVAGVAAISSISSYNITYYNIPLYIAYKDGITAEDAQQEVVDNTGISLQEGLKLEHSKILSNFSVAYIKSHLFSYGMFHIIETAPFFFGSSIKNTVYSYNLLYDNDINYIYPDGSVMSLLLQGNMKDFFGRISSELIFLIERLFWLCICIIGLFPVFKKDTRKISIICWLLILYFAILTGPVSYPRYRLPAEPYMFMTAALGVATLIQLFKKRRYGK
jgi:4-amino-4-deoxy-L-arabinose transferase-like glycosyltransferase